MLSIVTIAVVLAQSVPSPGPARVAPAAGGATAPRRIRLFDHMDHARLDVGGHEIEAPAAPPSRREIGFEPDFAERAWLGRRVGRGMVWEKEAWQLAALLPEGGTVGGALRIGPGIAEDGSYLTFVIPGKPLTRYVLRGRVKLVGHPAPDQASAREVVRIVEHTGHLKDPSGLGRYSTSALDMHRGSRTIEPNAWDRFELEIPLSQTRTDTLEIRLIDRTGGNAEAATWFDEVTLDEIPLTVADTWQTCVRRYLPNDGHAAETPWRLRVTLPSDAGVKETTKDAVLLPPGRRLAIPVTLPPAESQPLLRFAYAMLPEAFSMAGDGARIDVSFTPDGGESAARAPGSVAGAAVALGSVEGGALAIGSVEFDPKNNEEERNWLEARLDLRSVAGRTGMLTFATFDVGEPEPFDAVVIATPHIEPAHEPAPGLNVLVMASDTLRADRLSAFGYGRPTSPNLERLAAAGIRFPKTRSQAPWTLPSFSSIMTSLYPSEHGAGRGGHDEWTPLEPGATTLADVLALVGYETAGITANHLISPEYGLDQGFESYAIPGAVQWQQQGMESVDLDAPLVEKFLEEHRATPFFLFWHMMDPHLPYTTDAAFREKFTAPDYNGQFRGPDHVVPFEVLDPRPGRRWFTQEGPPKPPPLSDADRQFVSDYYDAEIGEIDSAIGRVLDALQRTGLWERTIVCMVADHGEGLGDHGHYHHGYTLFEDQVHIPLIVRVPGRSEGSVRNEPTAAIDLAPTILGALGLSKPDRFHGIDRFAAVDANAPPAPIFLEYPSYDSSAEKGCVLGDWKYLHDPWFHTEALYDTVHDPAERSDVKADHPEIVARARAELDRFRWERLQQGRFHIRVHGRAGAKLRLAVSTDDLFDANFAVQPPVDEHAFTLDLDRKHLILETTMASDRLELVCWCRGNALQFEVALDGAPIEAGIRLGGEADARSSPLPLERAALPVVAGAALEPPKPSQAVLWLEPGSGNAAPIVPTPEQAEMLRALGYAH